MIKYKDFQYRFKQEKFKEETKFERNNYNNETIIHDSVFISNKTDKKDFLN